MRHGIIFKATDGTARFIMPSGRMYILAYGAWRFKAQIHESMYTSIRSIAGHKDSKVFVANSRKVFMDKRVAFDPWDYQYMELCGTNQRMSKRRLFRRNQVATSQQVEAAAHATEASNRLLTGYLSALHYADVVLRAQAATTEKAVNSTNC